jgi:aldehyde:ferredoxin oxidoreductase
MPDEIKAVAMQAGMDTHTLHAMIQWAVKLYGEGVIDRRHTRGLVLAKRDMGSLVEMASNIAQRRNLGRLMGQSPLRAASKLGMQHLKLFPSLAELMKIYGYDHPMGIYRHSAQSKDESKRWKPFKGTGTVPLVQLYKRIADCLGVGRPFESEKDVREIQVPHLSELLRVNTGLTLGTQDLLVIAYRVWALERLFNIMASSSYRRQNTDELNLDVSAAGRFPVNEIDLRGVNKIRQMTDRHFRANGWGPKEAIKKRGFTAIGVGDLWDRKNA